jgi:hypothetical protein
MKISKKTKEKGEFLKKAPPLNPRLSAKLI